MTSIVKIALPLPVDNLYSYRIESRKHGADLIGYRALVPFGKSKHKDRQITGIIVAEDIDHHADAKLKDVIELLDFEPSFTDELMQLTRWIAGYYLCSWGEAFKAALPSGLSPKSFISIKLKDNLDFEKIDSIIAKSKKRELIFNFLKTQSVPVSVIFLQKKLKLNSMADSVDFLIKHDIVVVASEIAQSTQKKTQKGLSINSKYIDDESLLKDLLDELDAKAPRQASLISYIYLKNTQGEIPLSASVRNELKITDSVIKALISKNILIYEEVDIDRSAISESSALASKDESKFELTDEQSFCRNEIESAVLKSGFKPFLLHGVTGSGKTLVYIHAIKKALDSGKSSLLLVPEISLTPQLIDRFRIVFGNSIVALHSRMSEGERFDAWRSIKSGEKKIVIGARSAVFAPLMNLGLIIVDEEHESSYKQDAPAPRYHARDTAVMRAKICGIPVVLGSATPSLESMYNAQSGRYNLLNISKRADKALLPDIMVVDKLTAMKSGQMQGPFSKSLLLEIGERLEKKEGVILFHNRRGFASFLECNDCGYVPMCKNCDVSLTYHKNRNQLRCHYCGYSIESFRACPACGHPELDEQGSGTQRIEDELFEILTANGFNPIIQRVDLDSTMKKGSLRKILHAFAAGEIDILVGTQMVAKGLDFERVTLVGVVTADIQLFIPDFRSVERTYQLLTQVAGRAGRSGSKPGEVLIQTAHPKNPAISATISGSYDLFYSNEIETRRKLGYPPFSRFIHIEFSGKNEKKVDEISKIYFNLIPDHPSISKLGPALPLIPKLMNNYRRYVIVKSDKSTDASGKFMHEIIKFVQKNYNAKYSSASVRVTVNVDSFNSL